MRIKVFSLLSPLLFVASLGFADASVADQPTPKPIVTNDTPEQAASELSLAFIQRDFDRFNGVRLKLACEGRNDPVNYYVAFRNNTTLLKDGDKFREADFPTRLKRVSAVAPAKPFPGTDTENLLFSFGILYGYSAPMFVDVTIEDQQGNQYLHRTIVFQSKYDEKWYARPQLSSDDRFQTRVLKQP